MYYFGSDKPHVQLLADKDPSLKEKIHPALPYIKAEIVWAVQHEMCMTVEDALSRRTRALLLDARAAVVSAPVVAKLMANEMNKDAAWEKEQIEHFNQTAKSYLPTTYS